ncbi:MAG: hypothetical protein U0414_33475 [Polyangiaceae bacterium]
MQRPRDLRLGPSFRFELRRFADDETASAPLPYRTAEGIRGTLASLRAHPADAWALRRFVHDSSPGWSPPLDEHAAFARASRAVELGEIRLGTVGVERLGSYGRIEEEAPVSALAPREVEAAEETCVPCKKAAASARALREAAAAGSPFIAEM